MNWQQVLSGAPLAISLLTSAVVFGEQRGQVAQHTKDIAQLQVDGRTIAQTLGKIETSTARIETALDFLLPAKPRREENGR